MEYLIGGILAGAVFAFGRSAGFDRDRVFYPTVLIVVATYYILFAVMARSMTALLIESLVAGVFVMAAVAGFKINLWLVAAALAAHGVFDFFHHRFIRNPGVPIWWPGFCLGFDVVIGGLLAVLLTKRLISRAKTLMGSGR